MLNPTNEEANKEVIRASREKLTFENGRYWVEMPWISRNFDPNYGQVLYRFNKLITHLNETELFDRYDAEIQQLKANDHSELVVNVVFDGSGHSRGNKSLNHCLSKGVDLNPLLLQVLTGFRLGRHGVIADLKQAFLQIRLHQRDRDYFKFLWVENGRLVTYRFTSVPFGATASPYLLNLVKTIHFETHREKYPIVEVLKKSMYVDDLAAPVASHVEIENLHKQTTALFDECSMSVHKWRCSVPEIDRQWAGADAPAFVKVLGTKWQVHADELGVQFDGLETEFLTKRAVLKQIGSLYDPLGIAGPVACAFKLFLQQLTVENKDWDSPVPDHLAKEFNKLKSYLPFTERMQVPRCIVTNVDEFALATFCDASTKAYGAVVYTVNLKTRETVLVASRSRLHPVKRFTVPRAELMAAVVGAELTSRLRKWTGIERFVMFTDATTVLAWIATHENRLEVFIRNRVQAIRSQTAEHQWHHVSTAENPADVLSRGCNGKQLLAHPLWWRGPELLQNCPETIFTKQPDQQMVNMAVELRQVANHIPDNCNAKYTAFISGEEVPEELAEAAEVPGERPAAKRKDADQWSPLLNSRDGKPLTWSVLISDSRKSRIWRNKRHCTERDAVIDLYKRIQSQSFATEIANLRAGKKVPRSSKVKGDRPFIDDYGLLRLKTRVQTQSYQYRNPLLLDISHAWTRLLVKHLHSAYRHMKENPFVDLIGCEYKILGLRAYVKTLIFYCANCHASWPKKTTVPTGPIPKFRTQKSLPFQSIGIDFAGPLYVKRTDGKQGLDKRWLFIATCAVTRAVHLELLPKANAEGVWDAFRRMASRRGQPSLVYSDNGKQLVKASKMLKNFGSILRRRPDPLPEWLNAGIQWKFSSPYAPWQGGFFERMIREVKVILTTVTRNNKLSESGLITLL